ncbi:MAG TPA: cob(I)yrinic acid a,c-diamide adenosyltransferase [Eggerthellaceae bacterium]|nr:cob(I)yrinic acid a,c-diamide adenosyltransferase [Eggerthellaceae bacterium]
MEQGYFEIYTGCGKGKTTASMGLAMRAVGSGLGVYIGQYYKNGDSGEVRMLLSRFPDVTVEEYGFGEVQADVRPDKNPFFEKPYQVLTSGEYDVVILDEMNVAVEFGLLSEEEAIEIIDARPQSVELVFTGRNALPSFVERADLVSEVLEIKHYYNQGVGARAGIEY